jgi:hypothetical protein
MAGDWSEYGCGREGGMQNHRPKTAIYEEIQRLNIPVYAKFLSMQCLKGLASGQQEARITAAFLKSSLQDWSKINHPQEKINGHTLSVPLNRMTKTPGTGITFSKPGGYATYKFKWVELKSYMEKDNLFDDEVL